MTAVEVCPECDIAGCRHIRDREKELSVGELLKRIKKLEGRVSELEHLTMTMRPMRPAKQEPDPEFMKRVFDEAIERMKKNEN